MSRLGKSASAARPQSTAGMRSAPAEGPGCSRPAYAEIRISGQHRRAAAAAEQWASARPHLLRVPLLRVLQQAQRVSASQACRGSPRGPRGSSSSGQPRSRNKRTPWGGPPAAHTCLSLSQYQCAELCGQDWETRSLCPDRTGFFHQQQPEIGHSSCTPSAR